MTGNQRTLGKMFIISLFLAFCFAFVLAGTALANTKLTEESTLISSDDGYESDELREKNIEVDHYIFEERGGDFTEIGFTVTHTGPHEGKIEIGIKPYQDEYAAYLYDIFGDELVKVVEGEQAMLFTSEGESENDSEETAQTIVAPTTSNTGLSNTWIFSIVVAAILLLGGLAYIIRRTSATKG